ncbi:DNA (cytosine-5-)-methyltransferase [Ancistrocladus abbreviatus]
MGGKPFEDDGDDVSWNTDDELEIEDPPFDSTSAVTSIGGGNLLGCCEASSSVGPSSSKLFSHFVGMGFSEKLVRRAIEENGEDNSETILETLLTYSALGNSPQNHDAESSPIKDQDVDSDKKLDDDFDDKLDADFDLKVDAGFDHEIDANSDIWSSDYEENCVDDFSDSDSCPGIEETSAPLSDKEQKLLFLADMGYPAEEASIAIERCGPGSSIEELANFIFAAQMARADDDSYADPVKEQKQKFLYRDYAKHKKRKMLEYKLERKRHRGESDPNDEPIRLPNPMVGFGVPTEQCPVVHRALPEAAIGPPYFYYENVALAPKGVWDTISRFLYDIEPEFVDSKYFCAAARKRGYVHNLPIGNRFPLLPLPPHTVHEALPLTKKWWPSWDTRTKLNCLQTAIGSAKLTERIRKAVEEWDSDPPMSVQKYVLDECRKWNLVWVGRNKVAPLEPDEVEMLLGFPRNHTRGGGISRTDRYKSLGNSFQVDTVAYHLSVLKDMFPGGITVLSLFSGIGGAEVALHRLGIPLKAVVSVEISEVNRNIVRSWWEQTNQKGNLIDIADVQQLTGDRLEQLISSFGGFDLVVGGSPCNNLAGSNRVSRDGLEGKESSLFFDYFRILDLVKCIMGKK